jgi:hypothetical protein
VSLLLVPLYLLGSFAAFFRLSPLMGVLGVYALYCLARQVTVLFADVARWSPGREPRKSV